jgi:hypothetical protein
MKRRFTLDRTPALLLLPALALTLAACGDDGGTPTETETDTGTDSSSDTGTTEIDVPTTDPSTTTTTDPSTTTTTAPPTTGTETTDPTTEPITSDPSTSTGPGTTDTSTGSTGTTGDTDTDTDTDTDSTTGGVLELVSVWATSNPAALAADAIVGLDIGLTTQTAKVTPIGDVVSIQTVALAGTTGVISVDLPGMTGGVIIDTNMTTNPPATAALGLGDRFIRGPLTDLKTPKGVETGLPGNVFLVADTGAADMKGFILTNDGDVAPLFEVEDLGGSPAIWDMHYIGGNTDTLYAAGTDGVVRVYETFNVDKGANGPTRSITPAQNGAKISVNLHGVSVLNNVLYLTDVGDAMNTTDGQVFVINNASAADGMVDVTQRIQGGKLGNPVDLEVASVPVVGTNIYVAEKSNDALIVYNKAAIGNPPFMLSGDITRTKLESVARIGGNSQNLVLSSNPAGVDADFALVQNPQVNLPPDPSSVLGPPGSITSIQSLVLNADGDGAVSFDGPAASDGGGHFVIPGLTALAGDSTADAIGIRLWGPATDVVAPKGLVINEAEEVVFLADFGASDVKVFSALALGDEAPLFVLGDFGAAPWDVAYDDAADLLFVAGVDGVVRVYDDALANQGGMPDRVITPTNANDEKISVNLHGIEYDAATNKLYLSDVGSAMNNMDGQLFVIENADVADDNVVVLAQVGGDQTNLGNPVDIAWDGVNLYVAEKANSFVLRFDGLADLAGPNNVAPSASIAVTAAESVQLYYAAP